MRDDLDPGTNDLGSDTPIAVGPGWTLVNVTVKLPNNVFTSAFY